MRRARVALGMTNEAPCEAAADKVERMRNLGTTIPEDEIRRMAEKGLIPSGGDAAVDALRNPGREHPPPGHSVNRDPAGRPFEPERLRADLLANKQRRAPNPSAGGTPSIQHFQPIEVVGTAASPGMAKGARCNGPGGTGISPSTGEKTALAGIVLMIYSSAGPL